MEKNKLKSFLTVLIALLSLSSNVGCSTAKPAETSSGPSEIAWDAYSRCLEAIGPYGDPSVCNSYNSMNQTAYSYNQYIIGNYDQSSGSAGGELLYRGFSADSQEAYKAYLATLDEETLNELTANWIAIAEEQEQSKQ